VHFVHGIGSGIPFGWNRSVPSFDNDAEGKCLAGTMGSQTPLLTHDV